MRAARSHPDELVLGLVSVSDRASRGAYEDQGLPALKAWFARALKSPFQTHERLIADERSAIESTLNQPEAAAAIVVFVVMLNPPPLRAPNDGFAVQSISSGDASTQ